MLATVRNPSHVDDVFDGLPLLTDRLNAGSMEWLVVTIVAGAAVVLAWRCARLVRRRSRDGWRH